MAKKVTNADVHAEDDELEDKFLADLDVSVDLIDDRLYLGNVATVHNSKTLETLGVTHILTIDVVPLPQTILSRANLTFKFVKLADVPKEDLITQLPMANEFITNAIASGGTILAHCYYGVSRSAAVVIAYIMQKYGLCYEEALALVRSKRRFAHPNIGFEAQLRLFGHMGYRLNKDDPRFKQYRLRMAGQKLKQVKILPQSFADLVKPDPGLARERPDPIVYRCKKCRRVVATQGNLIPHIPKQIKVELAKKGIRPPPSTLTGLLPETGQILMDKLQSLCLTEPGQESDQDTSSSGNSQILDGYNETNLIDGSIAPRTDCTEACRLMWFVEPMSWMKDVNKYTASRAVRLAVKEPHGKLHCPKCHTKIGSFSWVMGCKCPCGQKVAPAFYLVPSKVEWSNIVQNVQITI